MHIITAKRKNIVILSTKLKAGSQYDAYQHHDWKCCINKWEYASMCQIINNFYSDTLTHAPLVYTALPLMMEVHALY